jgi:hypothetical protein
LPVRILVGIPNIVIYIFLWFSSVPPCKLRQLLSFTSFPLHHSLIFIQFDAVLCDLIKKLRGFSPPANYTDRATAASRRS